MPSRRSTRWWRPASWRTTARSCTSCSSRWPSATPRVPCRPSSRPSSPGATRRGSPPSCSTSCGASSSRPWHRGLPGRRAAGSPHGSRRPHQPPRTEACCSGRLGACGRWRCSATAMVAMRDALDARITLEVAIVRLTHPEADDDPGALLETDRTPRAPDPGARRVGRAPALASRSPRPRFHPRRCRLPPARRRQPARQPPSDTPRSGAHAVLAGRRRRTRRQTRAPSLGRPLGAFTRRRRTAVAPEQTSGPPPPAPGTAR